jgi:microcin C transport system permease protein
MTDQQHAISPTKRTWIRFKQNKRSYYSLIIFLVLFVLSMLAELIANDKPLIAHYEGRTVFPMFVDYPETAFGGDFDSPADFLDPFITNQFDQPGKWAIYTPSRYSYNTLNYFAPVPNPAPPSAENWLGTDDRGRDVFARLIYGFRLSILFGLALTVLGIVLGVITGAIQGYFAGRTDLIMQRILEIWGSMPDLYLLIIFSSIFEPSLLILLLLLSMFGWLGLSDYVRADFLRNRNLDYVQAARALGLSNLQIIWRHVLPNSLTSVITFLPFRMSAAILSLTSLDFLGLGVPPSTPSLGELLAQGKNNMDAWWIALSTFLVLTVTLLLLTNIGSGLRQALDVRRKA